MMDQWQLDNDRYLSAAMKWIRLRLARLIQGSTTESAPAAGASSETQIDDQIAEAELEMKSLEQGNPPPALIELQGQLGLSPFERNVLLLCAALEFDTRVPGLCAYAQGDLQRSHPTFALALALFDDPAWEALSPQRPLRYWRLIEINQPGAQPLTSSALRADERIVNYIKGLNALDDRLAMFIHPLDSVLYSNEALPPSQQRMVDEIIRHWQATSGVATLPIVQMVGRDPMSKQWIAVQSAVRVGRYTYRLAAESLPAQANDLETLARLWQRESTLLPLALFLDAQEVDSASAEQSTSMERFLSRAEGILFLSTREGWPQLPRAHVSLEINKPTSAEQRAAWQQNVGDDFADTAARLAAQFDLNVMTIAEVAQRVLSEHGEDDPTVNEKLWASCCAVTRPRLEALAQRLDAKATWDDLVLPAEQTDLLHQISYHVQQCYTVYEEWGFARKMNRGLGISALFAGGSGTGKTMAAEVIANELKLDLYRIDLSAVVSKYIGETEKNLRKLFDAAETRGAILFFDEADALFGKRSEVKDSHDRYANIEVNYLLQRMEAYRGLAILATNRKDSLDTAFMRRLRFIVNFPFPDAYYRKLIWQKVFPMQVPMEELDYERLARFDIAGGNIMNISVNAAFSAAQLRSKVTMPILLSAVQTEFSKMERLINKAELRV
jgi:hypothetical protein